jgi:hypothetical protein
MFRTAAVVYLLLGASMAWRFGFTDYDPPHRLWGVVIGLLALVVGVFLFGVYAAMAGRTLLERPG